MAKDLVTAIEERMWTEKEAAYLLHVSPATLTHWRKQKKITYFRLPNGTIRYRKFDLDILLFAGLCELEGKVKNSEGGK